MFLLDTNTLIAFFKGTDAVGSHLTRVPPSQVGVPSVVVYELETGIAKSAEPHKRRHQLDRFLSTVTIVAFGHAEAVEAGRLRARLEKAGTPIGPIDLLIAGTVLAHSATLVTRNLREFQRVPDLRVVSWHQP